MGTPCMEFREWFILAWTPCLLHDSISAKKHGGQYGKGQGQSSSRRLNDCERYRRLAADWRWPGKRGWTPLQNSAGCAASGLYLINEMIKCKFLSFYKIFLNQSNTPPVYSVQQCVGNALSHVNRRNLRFLLARTSPYSNLETTEPIYFKLGVSAEDA